MIVLVMMMKKIAINERTSFISTQESIPSITQHSTRAHMNHRSPELVMVEYLFISICCRNQSIRWTGCFPTGLLPIILKTTTIVIHESVYGNTLQLRNNAPKVTLVMYSLLLYSFLLRNNLLHNAIHLPVSTPESQSIWYLQAGQLAWSQRCKTWANLERNILDRTYLLQTCPWKLPIKE